MAFFKALTLLTLLMFTGCQTEQELGDCDDISMKCYRGYPRACNKLKTKCDVKAITYTSKRCQAAFNQLILGKTLKAVEEVYGHRISGCFNDKEIERYSK